MCCNCHVYLPNGAFDGHGLAQINILYLIDTFLFQMVSLL